MLELRSNVRLTLYSLPSRVQVRRHICVTCVASLEGRGTPSPSTGASTQVSSDCRILTVNHHQLNWHWEQLLFFFLIVSITVYCLAHSHTHTNTHISVTRRCQWWACVPVWLTESQIFNFTYHFTMSFCRLGKLHFSDGLSIMSAFLEIGTVKQILFLTVVWQATKDQVSRYKYSFGFL